MNEVKSSYTISLALFLTIGVAGATMMWFLALAPALRQAAARDWLPVQCTVVHTSMGDRSYLNRFTYTYQGTTYHGDQYSFFDRRSNVRYQDGARVMGALNPRHPEEAVLRPAVSPSIWAYAGLAAFTLIPLVGAIQVWRIRARAPAG